MSVFSNNAFADHERVVFCCDPAAGLQAIIAIHSTALGPAAGGCRLWSYATDDEALTDVLRLAQGMSYKNAMAGLKLGGGKAVILKGPNFDGADAVYERFGDFVNTFQGDYITAEDVGMTVDIMQTIRRRTKYVTGLPRAEGRAGGDPSPKTSYGVLCGIEAAVRHKLKKESLSGLRVAVQGVGNVGFHLCRYLHEAGSRLVVADIDPARSKRAATEFGAEVASLDELLFSEADVLAPCALGAVFDEASISRLQAPIIAGGANNQLATDDDGARLRDAGVLYAPDYVINAGGIINVASEYYGDADDAEVLRRVAKIGPRLATIFEEADARGMPTNLVADDQAREIIRNGR